MILLLTSLLRLLSGIINSLTVAEVLLSLGSKSILAVNSPISEKGREVPLVRGANKMRVLLAESRGCSVQLVVRNLGEQVVDLVGADVVNQIIDNGTVGSINRGEVALDISPLGLSIPRSVQILMVKEGGQNQITHKHKKRSKVVEEDRSQTKRGARVDKNAHSRRPGDQTSCHGESASDVDILHRGEMTLSIKIDHPGEGQTADDITLGQIRVVVFTVRVKDLILVDVAGVFVMKAVSGSPRLIGNQDKRMKEDTHYEIDG